MPEGITSKEQERREFYRSILTHFPDKSTRWLLEDKENVECLVEILADELVEMIDFSRLELQNRSFLSNKLEEQESDLIFSVPFKNGSETDELLIYILIEHQSTVDISMGFRLLSYMMNIWDTQRQEWVRNDVPKSEWRLRPILPIVFYSGDRRWQVPLSVTTIMDIPDVLIRFVPTFETLFLNVKGTDTAELTKTDHPFGWLLAVLHNEKADKETIKKALIEAIEHLNTLGPEQAEHRLRALHYFVLLIVSRRPSEEHDELIDLVNQYSGEVEVELMARSMADVMMEKGIAQGKAQGIEQGIEQGETGAKRAAVIKLLTYQFPDVSETFVAAIHEIQERSQLDALFDQILTAKTFDDIDFSSNGK